MWLELSTAWVNTDHLVRVEIVESPRLTATLTSTKPGGSDRTIFHDDDVKQIREWLQTQKQGQTNGPAKKRSISRAS